VEQTKKTEGATLESIDCLRAEVDVIHKIVAKEENESATRMQPLEEQSERKESVYHNRESEERDGNFRSELTEALRLLQFNGRYVDLLVAQQELQVWNKTT
jgi:hypothetical protein